jgi:cytochrome c-type biogenesis protein CcmE
LKPRTRRLLWIVLILAVLGTALALILNAFQSNLVFFFTPSQIARGEAPKGRAFRVGGLVQMGSVVRNGVDVSFIVTDQVHNVQVNYSGILPDLFKPGKGVVAQGKLQDDGRFVASEVLAKHDENYMPPEAAQALQQARLTGSNPPTQTGASQ